MPGKSHGQRSVVAYSPWGRRESDTTEHLILFGVPWLLRNNFTEFPVLDKANLKPQWSREKKKTKTIALSSQNVNKNTNILQTTKCPNMPLFLVNMKTAASLPITASLLLPAFLEDFMKMLSDTVTSAFL